MKCSNPECDKEAKIKYCSLKCVQRYKSLKTTEIRICCICEIKYKDYKKHKVQNSFCSYKCHGKWLSENNRGKNNPFYGKTHTKENRKKISISNSRSYEEKYGKEKANEMRKNLSESHQGEKNHFYGKKHTKETKIKIANRYYPSGVNSATYGRKHTSEERKKMSDANVGKILSEEHKRKISKSTKGIKKSEETKKKMRLSALKRIEKSIVQVTPFYNFDACILFDMINEELNWNGQHAENGGEYRIKELGYFPDFYDEKHKIIIEYYEKEHYKNKNELNEKTILRENEIREYFKDYKFIRINAYDDDNLKIEIL